MIRVCTATTGKNLKRPRFNLKFRVSSPDSKLRLTQTESPHRLSLNRRQIENIRILDFEEES
jgi:hypothetical protein